MTYWRYWDLNGAPFSGDATQPLYRGVTVEEALARIDFLVSNRRNLGLIHGPSGIGKSSILRHTSAYPPATAEVPNVRCLRTSMLGLASGELVRNMASRLIGNRSLLSPDQEQPGATWNRLSDFFNAAQREDLQTVLLLDDAESATRDGEADLCRLLSMSFPLTVILAAESEALSLLSPALVDRTELQLDLPTWEISQTGEFLAWSLGRVGREQPVFTDQAVERIQQFSGGIPRKIVQIADLSLVAGAVMRSNYVDLDCVNQVAQELPKSVAA